jgi:hypothetical protein
MDYTDLLPVETIRGQNLLVRLTTLEKLMDTDDAFEHGIEYCTCLVFWVEAVFNQPSARCSRALRFTFTRPPMECNCIWAPVIIRVVSHAHTFIRKSCEMDTERVISLESCELKLRNTRQMLGFLSYVLHRAWPCWTDLSEAQLGVTRDHVVVVHAILRSLALWYAGHTEFMIAFRLQNHVCVYPTMEKSHCDEYTSNITGIVDMISSRALSAVRLLFTSFQILKTDVPASLLLTWGGDGTFVFEHKQSILDTDLVPSSRASVNQNRKASLLVGTWPGLSRSQWLVALGMYQSGLSEPGRAVACFRVAVARGGHCSRLSAEESSAISLISPVPASVGAMVTTVSEMKGVMRQGDYPFDWNDLTSIDKVCCDLLPFNEDARPKAKNP